MNFAPYQDESPDIERALSPPNDGYRVSPNLRSPRASLDAHVNVPTSHSYPGAGFATPGPFETSLPIRIEVEAMLAYLLLPPVGGVLLLLIEHNSDYVRFHAWQSSMLFATMFVVHLLFCWSSFLSWTLLIIDLLLIGFLGMHAYQDVDTLDHFEVPIFGRLANSFVDDE